MKVGVRNRFQREDKELGFSCIVFEVSHRLPSKLYARSRLETSNDGNLCVDIMCGWGLTKMVTTPLTRD